MGPGNKPHAHLPDSVSQPHHRRVSFHLYLQAATSVRGLLVHLKSTSRDGGLVSHLVEGLTLLYDEAQELHGDEDVLTAAGEGCGLSLRNRIPRSILDSSRFGVCHSASAATLGWEAATAAMLQVCDCLLLKAALHYVPPSPTHPLPHPLPRPFCPAAHQNRADRLDTTSWAHVAAVSSKLAGIFQGESFFWVLQLTLGKAL